jgi:hypothetical protein
MAETREEEVLTSGGSSRWTLAGDREPGGRNELPSVEVLWLVTASLAGNELPSLGVLWLVTASLAGTDASDSGLGRLSSAIAHSVTEETATGDLPRMLAAPSSPFNPGSIFLRPDGAEGNDGISAGGGCLVAIILVAGFGWKGSGNEFGG